MKSILQTKILMIVTAICVVGYIAFGYFFPETGLDNLAPTDRLNLKKNIVVMGVDERSDDVGRSDTLFVVMFDSSNKSASCFRYRVIHVYALTVTAGIRLTMPMLTADVS